MKMALSYRKQYPVKTNYFLGKIGFVKLRAKFLSLKENVISFS